MLIGSLIALSIDLNCRFSQNNYLFFDNSLVATKCCISELNDHVEQMVSLICKTHGLPDPSSLATVSLVSDCVFCVCMYLFCVGS